MASDSKIEWTDTTWQVTNGCTRKSAGCDNCYAVTMTHRLEGMAKADIAADKNPGRKANYIGLTVLNGKGDRHFNGTVRTLPEALTDPLKWKRPRRVFVNSMSDLFHADVPFEFIDQVFDVMWKCPQHTFQVLTKRPERMYEFIEKHAARLLFDWGTDRINYHPMRRGDPFILLNNQLRNDCGWCYIKEDDDEHQDCQHPGNDYGYCDAKSCPIGSPIDTKSELIQLGYSADDYEWEDEGDGTGEQFTCEPNIVELHTRPMNAYVDNAWLGVSAENQQAFDERIEWLHRLRWEVPHATLFLSIEPLLGPIDIAPALERLEFSVTAGSTRPKSKTVVDWVIVGGESGPGARPCNIEWIRSIVAQCKAAGVACFVKQLGGFPVWPDADASASLKSETRGPVFTGRGDGTYHAKLKDKKGGDWSEWPEDLRVREMPADAEAKVQA